MGEIWQSWGFVRPGCTETMRGLVATIVKFSVKR